MALLFYAVAGLLCVGVALGLLFWIVWGIGWVLFRIWPFTYVKRWWDSPAAVQDVHPVILLAIIIVGFGLAWMSQWFWLVPPW